MGVFNPGTLQYGGDEVRLGEGADEGSLAIDHRVRNAPHPELVRQVRELIRFNTDGPHLRRGQRHPIGQAHGPGTVGSSRCRKNHHLGGLGQLRQCLEAFLAEASFVSRDPLDSVDQRRKLGARW